MHCNVSSKVYRSCLDTVSSTFKTNFTSSQDTAVSETLNTLRPTTEFILCLTGRRMMPRPRRDRKVWVSRRRRDRDVGVSRPRRDWDIGLTVSRRDREDQKNASRPSRDLDVRHRDYNPQRTKENRKQSVLYSVLFILFSAVIKTTKSEQQSQIQHWQ